MGAVGRSIQYGAGGEERSTFGIIFAWEGSALSGCYASVIVATVIAVIAVCITDPDIGDYDLSFITFEGHTMSLFPVAFLLVFRNGMSYKRYFEGRGHCGKYVHASRTLSRLARTATEGDEDFLREFRINVGRLLRAHSIAQRHSVRGTEKETLTELDPIVSPEEMAELNKAKKNLPLVMLVHLGIEIARYKDHVKHIKVFEEMDHMVDNLMEAWMGMHKLATTPMPFPFIQMLMGLMYLWIYTVPFPLAVDYGWAAVPITFLFGVAFFGIDTIGAELEDPLGEETNDLPLDVFEKASLQASKAMQLGFPLAANPTGEQPKPKTKTVIDPAAAGPYASVIAGPKLDEAPAAPSSPMSPVPAAAPPASKGDSKTSHKLEILANSTLSLMSAELQQFFEESFARYDLDGSGAIDAPKELQQFVTQLLYGLEYPHQFNTIMGVEVERIGTEFSWSLTQFVQWFSERIRSCETAEQEAAALAAQGAPALRH